MQTTRILASLLVAHLWATLMLGGYYTSRPVLALLSAHDLILILLAVLACVVSIFTKVDRNFFKYLIFLSLLMILTMSSSSLLERPLMYIARQSAILIYPILYGVIFLSLAKQINQLDIVSQYKNFFIVTLIVQSLLVGLYVFNLLSFSDYIYYSPMMLLVLAGSGAYIATIKKLNIIFKFALLVYTLILCLLIGHESLVISVFLGFAYMIIIVLFRRREIVVALYLSLSVIVLSSFSLDFILFVNDRLDYNLAFRLLYWRDALYSLDHPLNFLIGNQVGVMYSSEEFVASLTDYFGHVNGLDEKNERYVMAFHNSFLTVVFQYGLLGFTLLFYPLFKAIYSMCKSKCKTNEEYLHVLLGILFGMFVWCSFNVILELPHSSGYIWVIIFSVYFGSRQIRYEK